LKKLKIAQQTTLDDLNNYQST